MSKTYSNELENYLNKFLPHLNKYDFKGAIVSNNYRFLRRHEGIVDKVTNFFSEKGYKFKTYSNTDLIFFESGAKIHFTRTDKLYGLLLDAVLVISCLSTTTEDILRAKSRLWNHEGVSGNFWLLNIDDV